MRSLAAVLLLAAVSARAGEPLPPPVLNPTLFNSTSFGLPAGQSLGLTYTYASNSAAFGERVSAVFGDHYGGAEPGSFLFYDAGTPDNGNEILGDGGETVHYIQWATREPVTIRGYHLTLTALDPEGRTVQLVQLKVDEVERDFFDNNGATGPGYETFLEIARPFEEPVTGSIFRLSFTRTSNGPRIVEIDALTTTFCGNGILEPDEECDDGNTEDRDSCDAACQIEPACPDERVGACVEPMRASLTIDERRPGEEKVVAKMQGFDDATTQLDFGDPVGGNSRHSLCVYSGSALVLGLLAEPGETCGARQKPCWRAKGKKGWSYRDPRGEATGVRKIDAWSGKLGKGGLQVRARNDRAKGQEHLPVGAAAALEGSSAVHLQLRTREGRCYGTELQTIETSEGGIFEATTP